MKFTLKDRKEILTKQLQTMAEHIETIKTVKQFEKDSELFLTIIKSTLKDHK